MITGLAASVTFVTFEREKIFFGVFENLPPFYFVTVT